MTHEQLGGADTHNRVSGVAHFAAADEDDMASTVRALLSFMPSNNLDDPPCYEPEDDPQRLLPELESMVPEETTQALRHARGDRCRCRQWRVPGSPGTPRPEHHLRIWAARRAQRGGRRQPAECARRHARYRRQRKGGPLRPLLRRLQYSAGRLRGRARDSCRARHRNTTASSATAPSCFTPLPKPPCPR